MFYNEMYNAVYCCAKCNSEAGQDTRETTIEELRELLYNERSVECSICCKKIELKK